MQNIEELLRGAVESQILVATLVPGKQFHRAECEYVPLGVGNLMNLFLNFVHQSLVTLLDRPHIRPHAAEVLDQPTDIHSL